MTMTTTSDCKWMNNIYEMCAFIANAKHMHNHAHDRELHESYYLPNENAFAAAHNETERETKNLCDMEIIRLRIEIVFVFCIFVFRNWLQMN